MTYNRSNENNTFDLDGLEIEFMYNPHTDEEFEALDDKIEDRELKVRKIMTLPKLYFNV